MVDDIESVVLEYRPDYILAIDFDTHTDHRGVSISFEKAMERILKKRADTLRKCSSASAIHLRGNQSRIFMHLISRAP